MADGARSAASGGGQGSIRRRRRSATCRASATTSRPRRCRARCRSGRTRRSAPPTASTPSSCRARPSRHRAAPTSAPGSIASARRCSTAPSSARRRCRSGRRHRRTAEHDRPIGQLRWSPVPIPKEKLTFLTGMRTMTTAGDVNTQAGMAAHIYLVTQSMENDYFYNADGELLIVPQENSLRFFTEFGRIEVEPGEICVIPRGMKFKVELVERPGARLRVRELRRQVHAARPRTDRRQLPRQPARLQDAGGGLRGQGGEKPADREMVRRLPRHRARPLAARRGRLARQLRALQVQPAPLLAGRRHPTSTTPTRRSSRCSPRRPETAGTANIDFVIFPERWSVAEHSFRPPWYHMNIMSEFMGLIYGVYDAKPEGFTPGGISLHNCMLPHGPDKARLRPRHQGRPEAGQADRHHGLHVRDALSPAPDQVRGRARDAAGGLRGLLGAAGEEVHRRAIGRVFSQANNRGGKRSLPPISDSQVASSNATA